MRQAFTVLLGLLLFSNPQWATKVSAERRAVQEPPVRARFSRFSATGLGQGGIHGSIADLVDFFGFQPKSDANGSTTETIESDAGGLVEQVTHCCHVTLAEKRRINYSMSRRTCLSIC